MTKPARKREEIEKIKNVILEKALSIIIKKGYTSLTMRSLASATGMTATNLYNYFGGKDDIYLHLVIQGFEILHGRLEAAYGSESDPVKRIRAMIETYFHFGMENSPYYDIMFTLPTPKFRDYLGTEFEAVARIEMDLSMKIADLAALAAQEAAGRRRGMTREAAGRRILHIWSLLHGIISLSRSKVMDYLVDDVPELFQEIVDELTEYYSGD